MYLMQGVAWQGRAWLGVRLGWTWLGLAWRTWLGVAWRTWIWYSC